MAKPARLVKPTKSRSTGGALIEKRSACDRANMFDIRVGYRPQLQQMLFEAGQGCPTASVSAPVEIDGTWHSVVSVRQENHMACYVDGVMLGETTTASVVEITNNAVLTIGNSVCDQ
jgi:concanavalin A-like lectin/glucanase superfamily protein